MDTGYFVASLVITSVSILLSHRSGYTAGESKGKDEALEHTVTMLLAAEREGIITRDQIIEMRKMQIRGML